ncbi:hypothetical protein DVH24_000649 [Malus domestica]|uniref:Uncharacterized protein n=1 Tax=Malus domestica TaxID=3750 RepID=A0A498J0M0_MALDO|nr:hypothetical protein DVH24_000649 [Malus domestica]
MSSSEPPKPPADGEKRKSIFSSAEGESKIQKLSISSGDGGSCSVHQAAKAKAVLSCEVYFVFSRAVTKPYLLFLGIEEEEAVDEKTTEHAIDEEPPEESADEEPQEEAAYEEPPEEAADEELPEEAADEEPEDEISDEMLGDDGYDD